jgi:tRNA-Thr(GGU) m(6)t(6)A37 methyltransferase TsaA
MTPLDRPFAFRPIGWVRSPFRDRDEIPRGRGAEHRAEGSIELRPELAAGLDDIDGFSHLFVLWVFDRSAGFSLHSHPPTADRPHGVFSTRSPRRPNPIGLTVVELLGREGATLRVRGVDMLDGTPVLDLKPVLSGVPAERLRRGWMEQETGEASGARPVDPTSEGNGERAGPR